VRAVLPTSNIHRRLTANRLKKRPTKRKRQHFGEGRLSAAPSKSVFINCPFDSEYARLFDAIVFSVTACGFLARSALESGNVAESRMDRIANALFESKYSIHDLSRCRGEGDEGLARFNMPLELGIAMGRRMASKVQDHDWLILVPEGHGYVKFVSDLAGFDPKTHNATVESLIPKVVGWLATRPDAGYISKPRAVLESLPRFEDERRKLAQEWHGEVPWADLIVTAQKCVPKPRGAAMRKAANAGSGFASDSA
jgi:hypothetical protein